MELMDLNFEVVINFQQICRFLSVVFYPFVYLMVFVHCDLQIEDHISPSLLILSCTKAHLCSASNFGYKIEPMVKENTVSSHAIVKTYQYQGLLMYLKDAYCCMIFVSSYPKTEHWILIFRLDMQLLTRGSVFLIRCIFIVSPRVCRAISASFFMRFQPNPIQMGVDLGYGKLRSRVNYSVLEIPTLSLLCLCDVYRKWGSTLQYGPFLLWEGGYVTAICDYTSFTLFTCSVICLLDYLLLWSLANGK